jgi:hypothetical protein
MNRQQLLSQLFDSAQITTLPKWARDLMEKAAVYITENTKAPERNQCDGCQSDAPLAPSKFTDGLVHLNADGQVFMVCQAYRYSNGC